METAFNRFSSWAENWADCIEELRTSFLWFYLFYFENTSSLHSSLNNKCKKCLRLFDKNLKHMNTRLIRVGLIQCYGLATSSRVKLVRRCRVHHQVSKFWLMVLVHVLSFRLSLMLAVKVALWLETSVWCFHWSLVALILGWRALQLNLMKGYLMQFQL